ncbi:MAG: efflux RND transporter periplasmic adaptor subunit [Bacteroidales bacterium]
MKKIKFFGYMLISAALINACSPSEDSGDRQEEEAEHHPVKIMVMEKDSIERVISYTSNLIAFEEVNFAPSQPGRINKIFVEAGDRISKGQKLVLMDQTQLTQALLQLENARSNYSRMDTLYKTGSIPEQQYEQAKMQYEVALSNLEHLKENTTLSAPFNGIVTEKYFEAGEIYSGTPTTEEGKSAILTLMQISPLKAVVNISERYFPEIKENMKSTLRSDIYPDQEFKGSIHKVYPTINPATRSFKTEIAINNPDEKLRPGMFARVQIKIKDDEALLAPAIAVIKQEGTNNRHVFIHKNGKAEKVSVKTGTRYNDKIEILSTRIREGSELIIAGQAKLMDGDSVNVKR